MRLFYLLLAELIVFNVSSQSLSQAEEVHCSRKGDMSRTAQVAYYQYPSMSKYDMQYLHLQLAVEPGSNDISAHELLRVKAVSAMDSMILELRSNMLVDSVFINGTEKTFSQQNDHVLIPFGTTISAGATIESRIFYHGVANFGGVYSGTYNGLSYTASLSESYQAREWLPIKQVLADKLDSTDIWITTGAGNKAGSNGLLTEVIDLPEGKKEFRWHSKHPINYYLPSFAVGNYQAYINYAKPASFLPDSIPVIHYISPDANYLNAVKPNLDKTPVFIEKFSELFGLYPFADEKYGHAMANIGGGMEHQTMSTMVSFGSTLIAHELGHQWWGDHVTCATWNHIWLNEGFASYCEYLAIEKLPSLFPTTTASQYMQNIHDYVLSQPGGSVYVPDAFIFDENRIFSSRLSYDKGAAIIHNLRWEMQNDSLFFNTLKTFQQTFRDSVATADDMRQVAENVTGRSFADFINQWYYGEGYPTFNITYFKQGADSIVLLVNQTASAPSVTPFFKGYFQLKIQSASFDTTVVIDQTANNQLFHFHFVNQVTGIVVDPDNWVLNKAGTIENGGIIPVIISDFSVITDGDCKGKLSWNASQEYGIKNYQVQISEDGNLFRTVSTVDAKGEGSYTTEIGLPGGSYFVRLMVTYQNGENKFLETAAVNVSCGKNNELSIAPNPVHEDLLIQLWWNRNQPAYVEIYDAKGSRVLRKNQSLVNGANLFSVPVANLPNGIYFLKLSDGQTSRTTKFVKN